MRRKLLNAELAFALLGLVLVGAFAGPAWALLGALAGLLAWAALKKGAALLFIKGLTRGVVWFALLGAIAGAVLALIALRDKLRGEG
jgi:hypothetical protein